MIKTYAGFVQNTLHPMLDRAYEVIDMLDARGVKLSKKMLDELARKAVAAHCVTLLFESLVKLTITVIICITALKIAT